MIRNSRTRHLRTRSSASSSTGSRSSSSRSSSSSSSSSNSNSSSSSSSSTVGGIMLLPTRAHISAHAVAAVGCVEELRRLSKRPVYIAHAMV